MKKRDFLKRLGQGALVSPFLVSPMAYATDRTISSVGYDLPNGEDFWKRIRQDYALKPEYINLENGYYNIAPGPTLEKFWAHVKEVNYQGSYYMRTVQWDNKKRVSSRLAELV